MCAHDEQRAKNGREHKMSVHKKATEIRLDECNFVFDMNVSTTTQCYYCVYEGTTYMHTMYVYFAMQISSAR